MRKIFIFLIVIVTNISFSINFKDINSNYWYPLKVLESNLYKLEEGDIVIFKPLSDFKSSFGHIAIIGEDKKLIDFPNPSVGFRETPLKILTLFENREVLVLRYKYMTEEFKKKILKNIYSKLKDRYNLIVPRTLGSHFTYCSLFIYNIYEEVNEEKSSTIFPMQTEFIWPVDFLNAGKNFYIVKF